MNPYFLKKIPPFFNRVTPVFILLLALFPVFGSPGHQNQAPSGPLQFDLQSGDVLVVEKHQNITVVSPGGIQTREEKNKIVLNTIERAGNDSTLAGSFVTYSRTPAGTGDYRHDRTFTSKFIMEKNGHYRVPEKMFMPNLRSLPSFPERTLKIGDTWNMEASEVIELNGEKIQVSFPVTYRYQGKGKLKKEVLSKHKIKDVPYHRVDFEYTFDIKPAGKKIQVIRIQGKSQDSLFFDDAQGIPVYDNNLVRYTFHLSRKDRIRYSYKIDSFYKKIRHTTEEDKTEIADQIEKNMEQDSGVSVKKVQQGIVLEIDDILFDTDSSVLKDRAKAVLNQIGGILKKHPDREIRISGHTDNRGSEKYNQELSEKRARAVLEELKNGHNIESNRLSYRGFGESSPRASNDTPEGRRQNRRVEVLIVME